MSNNHSLERTNTWPLVLLSTIFILIGVLALANWAGGMAMNLYYGRIPTETDLLGVGEEAIKVKNTLIIGQIVGTIFGLIVLPLLYIRFLKRELMAPIFQPSWFQFLAFFIIAVSITFCITPLITVVGDWNKNMSLPESWEVVVASMRTLEDKAAQMTKIIVLYNSPSEMLLILFTVALLPAVSEELVFRGILQTEMVRSTGNIHVSVFVSAFIFSFIHLQFFGFFPRMLLGIVLGYLYFTSGNILISIAMHFCNNAMVVIAMNYYEQGKLKIDPESSKDLPIESIYVSLALSSLLLFYTWKIYKQRIGEAQKNV